MDDDKIRFSEVEIAELHTRYVRSSGTGAVINFLKRYIGKKVFVIVPKTTSYQDKEQASKEDSPSPLETPA